MAHSQQGATTENDAHSLLPEAATLSPVKHRDRSSEPEQYQEEEQIFIDIEDVDGDIASQQVAPNPEHPHNDGDDDGEDEQLVAAALPYAPDVGLNPMGFRKFASLVEGKNRYAPCSPLDDIGKDKIFCGQWRIQDPILQVIYNRFFLGLTLKVCGDEYVKYHGGIGVRPVTMNNMSKIVKLWGPRWFDHYNLAWPYKLILSNWSDAQELKALGLNENHFPPPEVRPNPKAVVDASETWTNVRPPQARQASEDDEATDGGSSQTPVESAPARFEEPSVARAVVEQRKSARLAEQSSQGKNQEAAAEDDEPDTDVTGNLARSGIDIDDYVRMARDSLDALIRLQRPDEDGSGQAFISRTSLGTYADILGNPVNPYEWTPYSQLKRAESSASEARVFSQCFCSAETGGPLGQLPSYELKWNYTDGNNIIGRDEALLKLKSAAPSKIPLEWTAKRLYQQLEYARFMKSAEHLDMIVDEWRRQYLEQVALRRDLTELLPMLDFDIGNALFPKMAGNWGMPFRRFLMDVLVAEEIAECFVEPSLENIRRITGVIEDYGPRSNCLRESTQLEICERYHQHAVSSTKPCYKEQAATYAPERNAWTLYQICIPQKIQDRLFESVHYTGNESLVEFRKVIAVEQNQAMNLLQVSRLDKFATRLLPFCGEADPRAMLEDPENAHLPPGSYIWQCIPIIKEYILDMNKNRRYSEVLEDYIRKADLLLDILLSAE